jgi:ADP-ribosylglycohydrolase
MNKLSADKIKGLIYGCAVGDALGVPFEFKERGTFQPCGMSGNGTHRQPAGTWSDDTSLSLALAENIAEGFDLYRLTDKMRAWWKDGYLAIDNNPFDIGITTQGAIERMGKGYPLNQLGSTDERSQGNGSLMRIAPMVIYFEKIDMCLYSDIKNVSALTHAHPVCSMACEYYIRYLWWLIKSNSKYYAFSKNWTNCDWPVQLERITKSTFPALKEKDIKSSGYVVDTLEAALWCFLNTDNYEQCILEAVRLGGDTDTTAAVAGAMAGMYYGFSDIPIEWVRVLRGKDIIDPVVEKTVNWYYT